MSRKLLLAAVAIAGAVFTAGAAQADPMLYIGVNEGGAPVDPGEHRRYQQYRSCLLQWHHHRFCLYRKCDGHPGSTRT